MVDPAFRSINRMFVFWFKNGNDDPAKDSLDKCQMSLVGIKDFNPSIDNKPIFYQLVKKNKKHIKNVLKCQQTMTVNRKHIRFFVPPK